MKQLNGYICAILAAMGFGASPLLASFVFRYGIEPLMLGFLRVFCMIPLFFLLIVLRRGDHFRLTLSQFGKIAFLAATGGVLTTALLYEAYTCLDGGTATTLNFSYPVFVLVLGIILYKDKISRATWVSFGLCFVGILMFCNPSGSFTWRGFFMALGSGICYAVYVLYMDKSHILEEMPFNTFTFYFFLLSSIIFLPFVCLIGSFALPHPTVGWLFVAIFALGCGYIATVLFQIGVQAIGSKKASILAAMEPVTSFVLGYFFLSEKITPAKVVGVLCVLASTMILVIFSTKEEGETNAVSRKQKQ